MMRPSVSGERNVNNTTFYHALMVLSSLMVTARSRSTTNSKQLYYKGQKACFPILFLKYWNTPKQTVLFPMWSVVLCLRRFSGFTNLSSNKKWLQGNSLAVQWLGRRAFPAEGPGSIPGPATKILQAVQCSQKKKVTVNSLRESPSALWDLFAKLWLALRVWWPLALTSGWVRPAETIVSQKSTETWGNFSLGQGKQACHINTLTITSSIIGSTTILPPFAALDHPSSDVLPSSTSVLVVTNGTGYGQRVRGKIHPQDLHVVNKNV